MLPLQAAMWQQPQRNERNLLLFDLEPQVLKTRPLLWSCFSSVLCTMGPPAAGTLPLDTRAYHRALLFAAGIASDCRPFSEGLQSVHQGG